MTTVTNKLHRMDAIRNNMDPLGNKWGISLIEGTSLYCIGLAPDNTNDAVTVPKNYPKIGSEVSGMEGMYTKAEYAQKAIETYLHNFWNYSDAQAAAAARKNPPKEQQVA